MGIRPPKPISEPAEPTALPPADDTPNFITEKSQQDSHQTVRIEGLGEGLVRMGLRKPDGGEGNGSVPTRAEESESVR